jgi:hypothetical protein
MRDQEDEIFGTEGKDEGDAVGSEEAKKVQKVKVGRSKGVMDLVEKNESSTATATATAAWCREVGSKEV